MRLSSLATVVGFLALAATAGASTPAAKPAAPAKPAWASGHLGSVDTATKSVVVKQGKHEMTFQLAPDATVTMGKTTIQAADPILHTIAGGEQEDRCLALQAQAAEHFPAVQGWQHHVEDDGIVLGQFRLEQAFGSIGATVYRVAFVAKGTQQAGQQIRLIFHNQQTHVVIGNFTSTRLKRR